MTDTILVLIFLYGLAGCFWGTYCVLRSESNKFLKVYITFLINCIIWPISIGIAVFCALFLKRNTLF